jgi:hypothetical protein
MDGFADDESIVVGCEKFAFPFAGRGFRQTDRECLTIALSQLWCNGAAGDEILLALWQSFTATENLP